MIFLIRNSHFDLYYLYSNTINKQYCYGEGYVTEQSHGGANLSSERRSIFLHDKVTDEEIEITIFSGYIDKNEYLRIEYLPYTKYGAI